MSDHLIAINSEHCKILENAVTHDFRHTCELTVNMLDFGSALNYTRKFVVLYDPLWAFFNFERPPLPDVYQTPRSILSKIEPPATITPAPFMPTGYTSEEMQKYIDKAFAEKKAKLPWDYHYPYFGEQWNYIHPGENRYLAPNEMEALLGSTVDLVAWLAKHITWYERKAWGKENFQARYIGGTNNWVVERNLAGWKKVFDFSAWIPRKCNSISDRYAYVRRAK